VLCSSAASNSQPRCSGAPSHPPPVIKTTAPDSSEAIQLALSHLSRIRVLHITASQESLERFFTTIHRPAPLLESLRFHATSSKDEMTLLPSLPLPGCLVSSVQIWVFLGVYHSSAASLISIFAAAASGRVCSIPLSSSPCQVDFFVDNLPIASGTELKSQRPVSLPNLSNLHFVGTVSRAFSPTLRRAVAVTSQSDACVWSILMMIWTYLPGPRFRLGQVDGNPVEKLVLDLAFHAPCLTGTSHFLA
jgi:hypothetical protein